MPDATTSPPTPKTGTRLVTLQGSDGKADQTTPYPDPAPLLDLADRPLSAAYIARLQATKAREAQSSDKSNGY